MYDKQLNLVFRCKLCGLNYNFNFFHKSKNHKTGYDSRCKKCVNDIQEKKYLSRYKLKYNISDLENEIWKDIPGYENMYQASNLGRVKSLERMIDVSNKKMKQRKRREIILKSGLKHGYNAIVLQKKDSKKTFLVHRLVAITFIPNPENKPQVNHINGIKTDNRVENLEWNDAFENMRHADLIGLREKTKGVNNIHAKLTENQVRIIKRYFRIYKKINKAKVGRKYNVNEVTIGCLIAGKTWKHIKLSP